MPVAAPQLRFLDPAVLRALPDIEIKARFLVEGMYASRHRSPYYGYSVEFKDHREYTAGDDPRTLDWKMLARTEKYFVRRFEMESNMDVVALLDISGSMGYQPLDPGRLTKLEYACYLAASLVFLVSRQQDSPGLVTFAEEVCDFIPPKQGKRHMFAILAQLESLEAGRRTDVGRALKMVGQRLRRRGIVALISDGHGDAGQIVDGVKHLAVRGHEVILFQVLDHDELDFPFKQVSSFRDLETGSERMCDPLRQRRGYRDRLDAFCAEVRAGVSACGCEYRLIDTVDPIEVVLRDYLLYRRER